MKISRTTRDSICKLHGLNYAGFYYRMYRAKDYDFISEVLNLEVEYRQSVLNKENFNKELEAEIDKLSNKTNTA
jgi:hypothetical protein